MPLPPLLHRKTTQITTNLLDSVERETPQQGRLWPRDRAAWELAGGLVFPKMGSELTRDEHLPPVKCWAKII